MEELKSNVELEHMLLDCEFNTRALHSGEHRGQPQTISHVGAIYQSSTFIFENVDQGSDLFLEKKDGYVYTRLGNPTVRLLEAKINALEGAEIIKQNPNASVATLAFASGMAAVSTAILATCKASDTIIIGNVMYGAVEHLIFNVLNKLGIKAIEVNMSDLNAVEAIIKTNSHAKAILFETPTNPLLTVADIKSITSIAKAINPNIKIIVDNTFATPYLQRPLELGADVVVHSTTKYIGGHGVVVGGLLTTVSNQIKDAAYTIIKDIGAIPSPFDTWLLNLGLKTLPIRMDKHCENAMAIAKYLETHPKVSHVFYPGLESSPYHAVAKKQMSKFGGMVSFELKDGYEAGKRLMDNIKIFSLAVSLGTVDSLIQHPASMTHSCIPKEKRQKSGITDGLIRISVGIENINDLCNALEDGLKKA